VSDYVIVDRERITVIPVPEGATIMTVHEWSKCYGRPCVIHNPSDHHMREYPLHWRADRGIFERICAHGIGHPDPDQMEYFRESAPDPEYREWHANLQMVHGCDGCCI
jgi:hypothetical protein